MLRNIALRGTDRLGDLLHHHFAGREQAKNFDAQGMRHGLHRDGGLLDIFAFADQREDVQRQRFRSQGVCGRVFLGGHDFVVCDSVFQSGAKCVQPCLRTTQDERVYVVRTFVGVHRFKIHHVADDVVFIGDTVAAVHIACHAGNV